MTLTPEQMTRLWEFAAAFTGADPSMSTYKLNGFARIEATDDALRKFARGGAGARSMPDDRRAS